MKNDSKRQSKTGRSATRVWLEKARTYAKRHATKHTFVTTDNVLAAVGEPANGGSTTGAIFRNGMFTKVGYTPSTRPSCHRREIGVWRLK